eukprot:TRINITY_DN6447_c0_g1_i1.p1 TRINITY_DN6447_c0_g1~~TRINITY_DN6447_c0_g1_i1.p1  ORF type:complete len:195 (+),score=22.45 TRINITY_DN6447_c0_g1_i1:62-646(+)
MAYKFSVARAISSLYTVRPLFQAGFAARIRCFTSQSAQLSTLLRSLPRSSLPAITKAGKQSLVSTTSSSSRRMATSNGSKPGFFASWMAPSPDHARFSPMWWWVWTIRFTVFAITGSSSMYFARPFVNDVLGMEGTMRDGPWSYRIASFLMVTPIYTVILLLVGTASGQHAFFLNVAQRMWSRLLPGIVKRKAS